MCSMLAPCSARQSKDLRSLKDTVPFELEQMGGAIHHVERLSMYHLVRPKGYSAMGIEVTWHGSPRRSTWGAPG